MVSESLIHFPQDEFLASAGQWARGLEDIAVENCERFIAPFGRHGGLGWAR